MQRDSLPQDLKVDLLPFPFCSQLENMPSTAGVSMNTDSFWQCRSPVRSSQMWAQNMQDIGVIEELVCGDDLNIPDVDMTSETSKNYLEVIKILSEHCLMTKMCHTPRWRRIYLEVIKILSEHCLMIKMCHTPRWRRIYPLINQIMVMQEQRWNMMHQRFHLFDHLEGIMDSPCPIRPSSSTLSFCISRFSAKSSGNDCHDSRLSPYVAIGDPSSKSPQDQEGGRLEFTANAMMRHKEKKHSRLQVYKDSLLQFFQTKVLLALLRLLYIYLARSILFSGLREKINIHLGKLQQIYKVGGQRAEL